MKKPMIFCHYCYEEILGDPIAKKDHTAYYHINCFAEMMGVELKEDDK